MSAQQPVIREFVDNNTVRWSGRVRQYIVWVEMKSFPIANKPEGWGIRNIWQLSDGDYVTITDRLEDVPTWFSVYPSEVKGYTTVTQIMERLASGYNPEGPVYGENVWRVVSGDRLVWIDEDAVNPIVEILDMGNCALVTGENVSSSWESLTSFGSLKDDSLPIPALKACRAGVQAAIRLGMPRESMQDWKFGY